MAVKRKKQTKKDDFSEEKEKKNLWERLKAAWKEIRTVGFYVFLIISLPSIGLVEFINSLSPKEIAMKEAGTLWNIATSTAPLTLGMVIIAIALIKEWFEGGVFIIFAGAVLAASTLLFNSEGWALIQEAWERSSGNKLFTFPLYIAVHYFGVYGWVKFCSAILVGAFGGYAFMRLYVSIEEPAE